MHEALTTKPPESNRGGAQRRLLADAPLPGHSFVPLCFAFAAPTCVEEPLLPC